MIDNLTNKVGNIYRGVVNKIAAPPSTSTFKETGQLIPGEFLMAGNQLIKACPAWQWRSAISDNYATTYLPKDKQFLVTDAISKKRIAEILIPNSQEKDVSNFFLKLA